jgi:subtilisin family serine protease
MSTSRSRRLAVLPWVPVLAITLLAAGCGDEPATAPAAAKPAAEPIPHRPERDPGSRSYVPRQLVVTLAPGLDPLHLNLAFGTVTLDSLPALNVYLLGTPLVPILDLLEQILGFTGVVAVDLNWLLESPEAEERSLAFNDGSFTPDMYHDQDFLDRLDAPEAHALSTGAGVRVAIVDTGADLDHPDLAPRIVAGGYDYVGGDAVPEDEADGVDQDQDGLTDEAAGHGTHVAGLVHLAAPEAELLPVRVLDSEGWGSSFAIMQGIVRAVDGDAGVINLSLGMLGDQVQLRSAVEYAYERGVVLVASAGNGGAYAPDHYPAGYPEVMAVAATGGDDRRASFSNYGPHIALSSPGVGLMSTYLNGQYAIWSGTSMAAPLVSGGAALVIAHRPGSSPALVRDAMAFGSNGIDPLNPGYAGWLGAGRVNLYGGLAASPAIADR